MVVVDWLRWMAEDDRKLMFPGEAEIETWVDKAQNMNYAKFDFVRMWLWIGWLEWNRIVYLLLWMNRFYDLINF